MSTEEEDERAGATPAELEHLALAWIRNGVKQRNMQLISCGRILLQRLGVDAPPMTNDERDMIEGAIGRVS